MDEPVGANRDAERRGAPRTPLEGRPSLRAEFTTDGVGVPCAVYPHDLSPQGIRGRWDMALPVGVEFPLTLELGEPVRLRARVAWQRALPRGAVLAGLSFAPASRKASAALHGYLAASQAPSRRGAERIPEVLPVEVLTAGSEESVTAIATDLSGSGIQLANDFRLPDQAAVTLLLPLAWAPPLEVEARVRWQTPTVFGGWDAGLEFVAMSDADRAALDAYLKGAATG